jgi:hypothetical protein
VSWKLAEYERHFNVIQAGLRGLASVWLLASFGAISTVLRREEAKALLVPAEWVIVVICAMGSTGLALLWVMDQLVYHRLLNAVFVVGLKLEHDDWQRPPIHAAMYASMPRHGFASLLSLFYVSPIAALAATALVAAGYQASQDLTAAALGLLALASVPAFIGALVESKSARERSFFREQASRFHVHSFDELFEVSPEGAGVSSILARFGSQGRSEAPSKREQ